MRTRLVEALVAMALLLPATRLVHAQDSKVAVTGIIANVSWGTSKGLLEVKIFEPTGRPISSFVDDVDLSVLSAEGLQRSILQRGDNIAACGSPSKILGPDGATVISVDLIIFADGRQVIFSDDGARACLSSVLRRRTPALRGRGGIPSTSAALAPLDTSPVPPPTRPPVEPVLASAVRPGLPLGVPTDGTIRPPVPPNQAPMLVPLSELDQSYLQLYDRYRPVQLTGRVTRVEWTQPNTYVYLTVNGVRWVVEASFTQFGQVTVYPAIRVGDTITVGGFMPKENPGDQLPAKSNPLVGPYLQSNHLARAGSITIYTGQRLNLGDPPTEEELQMRFKCSFFLGC